MTSPSNPPTTPPTPGEMLHRARETRAESLLQVAQATRISEEYLIALEADAPLSSFPAPVYARAFARAYGRHLELDEEEVLAAFSAMYGSVDAPPRPVVPIEEPPPKRRIAFPVPMAIRPPQRTRGRPLTRPSPSRPRSVPGRLLPRRRTRSGITRVVPVAVTPPVRVQPRRRGRVPVVVWLFGGALALGGAGLLLSSDVLPLGSDPRPTPSPSPSPPPLLELPLGGRTIFPDYRVVAFYGAARTEELGILGIGPDLAATQLAEQAKAYERPGRPVQPAFELIASVASSSPGEDGMYRLRQADSLIGGYLDAARGKGILMILDVQPGRSDFLTEVKVLEEYLKQPDVGLALDPEWHAGPSQVPGRDVGSIDAKTINRVGNYLASLVRRYDLPQKLFVVHQFTSDMVKNKDAVKTWPELATTFDVDGFGDRPNKRSKYAAFTDGYEDRFHHGIKLYYEHDTRLLGPNAVLRLSPEPDLIVYQ